MSDYYEITAEVKVTLKAESLEEAVDYATKELEELCSDVKVLSAI
jgi:SHS2 domain-containing protein